jgi:hypothetical protein
LKEKVAASVQKVENTTVGIRHAYHVALSILRIVGTNFADKRRSLGRYNSLAGSGHRVGFFVLHIHKLGSTSLVLLQKS